jgi:dipeptidyl aminopeptidase/acylaminoacyl peptidase
MLEKYSPALHANKITIPLLIVAGEDDDVVPFSQAKLMIRALKRHKKDFEYTLIL